jgi:hypothetical protein
MVGLLWVLGPKSKLLLHGGSGSSGGDSRREGEADWLDDR